MGGSKEPSQYPSQRVIHPPGAGPRYTFPAKMTSIVTCMGGRGGKKSTDQGPLQKSVRSGLCCLVSWGYTGMANMMVLVGALQGWPGDFKRWGSRPAFKPLAFLVRLGHPHSTLAYRMS